MTTRDMEVEAFNALNIICEDFRCNPDARSSGIKPTSPRYFWNGSEPGSIIAYLKGRNCVEIEIWEPDYATGGQYPSYIVEPTKYGMTILEASRPNGRLTFLAE
ncbi:MAG: hypothetical protein HYS80_02170 [Candidatus Aenigmarchaeota archaeon]|nr:hypothetical protein [Candidatus Aenigmarchaeota archaeon]